MAISISIMAKMNQYAKEMKPKSEEMKIMKYIEEILAYKQQSK
jgi:hypothetical protein